MQKSTKMKKSVTNTKISIIMGSQSDWKTLVNTKEILDFFKIPYEKKIISAHRTPERLYNYAKNLKNTNIEIIIAGAGGAAHLPGMVASLTTLPVLGVPIESKSLKGLDSLLSIVQMPAGISVPTFAIGKPGAINAALSAISILALSDEKLVDKLKIYRQKQTKAVKKFPKNT